MGISSDAYAHGALGFKNPPAIVKCPKKLDTKLLGCSSLQGQGDRLFRIRTEYSFVARSYYTHR